MDGRMPPQFGNVEDCVEQAISRVGRRIVLCAPIGAGKPVALVNAFYQRAAADPGIELAILTGLTLTRPRPASELERRLVEPITARVFGKAPEPAWIGPLRAGKLPPNIRVQEFFMEPGAWLHAPLAQQSYASINYTHVARSVLAQGANVVAQQVARRPGGRVSLGTQPGRHGRPHPDAARARAGGQPVAVIGQVNDRMPFMFGAAEMAESGLDFLVDDPRGYHELIAPPNGPIPTAEHAIALAASMLVRDGGTIQIGIGELGDAIVHALTLRHRSNADWRRALADIGLLPRFAAEQQAMGGDAPFEQGLYAVTEMFVDGFLDLYREGILKRRAGGWRAPARRVPARAARVLRGTARHDGRGARAVSHDAGELHERAARPGLGGESRAAARCALHQLRNDGDARRRARLGRPRGRPRRERRRRAVQLRRAGARPAGRPLDHRRARDARERRGARIEHPLELRPRDDPAPPARHRADGVRHRGHPRPERCRGRGRDDRDRRLALPGGARCRRASAPASCRRAMSFPSACRRNFPEALEQALAPHRAEGRFGSLPYGTDFSPEEIRLGAALRGLKARSETWGGKLAIAAKILRPLPRDASLSPLFERMDLAAPRGMRERLLRRLVAAALKS